MNHVASELAGLKQLSIPELRSRFAALFGQQTRAGNKAWLVKRVAWRLQSLAEGDLTERARQRAAELAHDADVRLTAPKVPKTYAAAPEDAHAARLRCQGQMRLPMPGSIITRRYKGD